MTDPLHDPTLVRTLAPGRAATRLGPVEFAEFGQGPPVVSLHGAMGGYDQGLILAQAIGESGYRYLAVSRPGYLGSPLATGASPEAQADAAAALLDSLGIDRAGVVAISAGGPCAVQFALRHPARCRGLVLVSTVAARASSQVPLRARIRMRMLAWPWLIRQARRRAQADPAAAARRSVHDPDVLDRTVRDPVAWPLFSALILGTLDRMAERLPGTRNDIFATRTLDHPLEDLRVPVLVVHGTADRIVPFDLNARRYERRVPGCRLAAIEGGEHMAVFTHRDAIRQAVAPFMARHFTDESSARRPSQEG